MTKEAATFPLPIDTSADVFTYVCIAEAMNAPMIKYFPVAKNFIDRMAQGANDFLFPSTGHHRHLAPFMAQLAAFMPNRHHGTDSNGDGASEQRPAQYHRPTASEGDICRKQHNRIDDGRR